MLLEEEELSGVNRVPGTWHLRTQAPAQTSQQPLPPKPKAARYKLQRKKLHPAVRMGIPCLPQVYGQGLRWEQSATELSLVGTVGTAGPLL